MKILYIAGRWPWPIEVGRQRMIDQSLRTAAELGEVHLLAFAEPKQSTETVPGHVKLAGVLPMSRTIEVAANLIASPRSPLQNHLFNSASARRVLDRSLEAINPDVVIIDMLRLSPLAARIHRRLPNIRLVLDMDDLLSVRYARMLRSKRRGDIGGTFQKKLPKPVRAIAQSLPSLLLRYERSAITRLEKKALHLFDAILLVSPTEAEVFGRRKPGSLVAGFPPLMEKRPASVRDHGGSLRFVFIGNAGYAPNAEALEVLDRAAAALKQRVAASSIPFRFEAAGVSNPDLSLPNIAQLGFVDDLGAFLSGDAVLVAPILTGTGIKTKIIDALEYATPIVTTDTGAEGLPFVPGQHFIRVEGEVDLVDALEKLVTDASARADLAAMGRNALDATYENASHAKLLATMKAALG